MFAAIRKMVLPAVLAGVLLPAAAFAQNYVGVDKCKSCHEPANKGKQHTVWKNSPHGKAMETLKSEESKKIAAKMNIADPTTDMKCVKCHDTGASVPADKLAKNFKKNTGVGCESCHGPGEKHVKARMASEEEGDGFINIPDTEIVKAPGEKVCTECHNKESPTFKAFKYADAVKAIAHPDPRKAKK